MVDFTKLKEQLISEEGRKTKPYKDTRGVTSIGIGRNLSGNGLRDCEIDFLYQNDINDVDTAIKRNLNWVLNLDEVRQRVFYDLCFNMGITRLLTFTHMIVFASQGNFDAAANELHLSLWDHQVGDRANKLENMLRTGRDA